jgi:preprotein translocase subunit SecF
MIPVIKYSKVWLGFSFILVVASIALFVIWGLNLGIDFTGGSYVQVEYTGERPTKEVFTEKLESLDLGALKVQPNGDKEFSVRTRFLSAEEYQNAISSMKELIPETDGENKLIEKRFEIVGPSIGKELKQKAWQALVAVLVAIIIYIGWAFRGVSRPVQSWKYGITAIIALFHDIAIPVGVFVLLGTYYAVEVDILFVTALLAILGYSVNDTIVVFDRVRENILRSKDKDFKEIVNLSVNQSVARSINTSVTLLFVLLAIYFFGGQSISYFILTLIIGVLVGTYSSIFVASPLLVMWQEFGERKK